MFVGRKERRMTRLIDADALIPEILMDSEIQPEWCKIMAMNIIRNQPTIDAVPVVRCSECKFAQQDTIFKAWYCHGHEIEPYGFCAWAERKEE